MSRLPNYLRSQRKRLALSQEEVAFLLGVHGGAKVCRHEQFQREPSLQTALAYAVILQTPMRELFAGLYEQAQREVAARAKILTHRVDRSKGQSTRRAQTLTSLCHPSCN